MKLRVLEASGWQGYVAFDHPLLGDAKVECKSLPFSLSSSLGWGAEGMVFDAKGIIIGKYVDYETNAPVYLIYLVELTESAPSKVESLKISTEKTTIDVDGTTGAGRTIVEITANPFDADMSTIELVATENGHLLNIKYDEWSGGYKVMANNEEGTAKIVAKSGDIVSNEIVITIKKQA